MGRAVRSRPVRASLAIAGVGTSTLLVLVLFAAYRSPVESIRGYIARDGLDLWIGPLGSDNIVRSSGVMPGSVLDGVREIEGVAAADPMLRIFVTVSASAKKGTPGTPRAPGAPRAKVTLLGMGYRVPDGLGGPPGFSSGRPPRGEKEIALDRAAAFRLGVKVGDTVRVNGQPAEVVGLTANTNVIITQFVFADLEAAERAGGLKRQHSFVIARLDPGADAERVSAEIRDRFPDVQVLARDTFLATNMREMMSGFLPLLTLIALLGVAASAVLVALLVQGMVDDRRADIAVLLALGAHPGRLASSLILHAATLVVMGGVLGAILARALVAGLSRFLPTIELTFVNGDLAVVLAIFCTAGILGALVPVARLKRIDPLEAFRT